MTDNKRSESRMTRLWGIVRRNRILSVFLFIVGVVFFYVLMDYAYNPVRREPDLRRQVLENALKAAKPGEVISLSSVLKIRTGTICVILPYQDPIPAEALGSTFFNNYLASWWSDIWNEGCWELAYHDGDMLSVSRFIRSQLDITVLAELRFPEEKKQVPAGFVDATCLPISEAVFLKIRRDYGDFIVFGTMRQSLSGFLNKMTGVLHSNFEKIPRTRTDYKYRASE